MVIFKFIFIILIERIICYQCPIIKKYVSKIQEQIFTDAIAIEGSNLILAKSSINSDPQTTINIFDMSTNTLIKSQTINEKIISMDYSKIQNNFLSFVNTLSTRNLQDFSIITSYSEITLNINGAKKSSINDYLIILYSQAFISYYLNIKTGLIEEKSFPESLSSTSEIKQLRCIDIQLKDYQVLSQLGVGRIDLYDISNRQLIISKLYFGNESPTIALIAGIPNTNILVMSLGTNQIYIWELIKNTITQLVEIKETISIKLIRYLPIKFEAFLNKNNESYIIIFSGLILIDYLDQDINLIFRDTILYQYDSTSNILQIKEAYPFYQLRNQNNWNEDIPYSQISISDQFRIMNSVVFLAESQRVYGFSFDTHYLFPFFENQIANQCDFDLDGNSDSYCRLPYIINKNNQELDKAFFILNDGFIFIANNEQTGFRIFDSNNLIKTISVLPDRRFERCKNCVQRLKNSRLNNISSSNIYSSQQGDEVIVFPKRFTIDGTPSQFQANWQQNQGIYFYNYSQKQLISVDLSIPMSTPNYKINLRWEMIISYRYNNLIYSCLSYNLPKQNTIQTGQIDENQINQLKSYFYQHNIECYLISTDTYSSFKKVSYSAAIDYNLSKDLTFFQTCEVSYSMSELICMNGVDELNFWTIDTLIWKKKQQVTSCNSVKRIFMYSSQNTPYLFIICPQQIGIIDTTKNSQVLYILQNISIQNAFISQSILFVALNSEPYFKVGYYDIETVLQNNKNPIQLGQFIDQSATSSIIQIDYQESSSSIYFANQQIFFSINQIDPLFLTNSNNSCDMNIYISQNIQNNLLQQKLTLIQQQKVGYPLSYGNGQQQIPYQNPIQIIEGLCAFETLDRTIKFSQVNNKGKFQINLNINLDNSKQNLLITQFFSWSISNSQIILKPQYIVPNERSVVYVQNETINITSWTHLVFNNISFFIQQPEISQKTVDIYISGASEVSLIQINLHIIPKQQNIQSTLSKNLITLVDCQQVLIDQYTIDSFNVTSTKPLFNINQSADVRIQNLVITNSYIENTIILSSYSNSLVQISDTKFMKNNICSYKLYEKYIKQFKTLNEIYTAIVFTINLNLKNIDISENNFCTGTNLIYSSDNQIQSQNSNALIIDKLTFQSNKYNTGLKLQDLIYYYASHKSNEESLISMKFTSITISQNQQIDLSFPWQIDPPKQSNTKSLNQQKILRYQNHFCTYFYVNQILSIDISQSSLKNESLCGMLKLEDIFLIKLYQLNFTNDESNLSLIPKRMDPILYIEETNDITISDIVVQNQYFLNNISILIKLEEYISQSITISNNIFKNIQLKSNLHYIQINLIYISTGNSDVDIEINDNQFIQISVSFSTSSQTISASCIASNSLVSDIIMNRNTFNDTYSDSINGALVLNARNIKISSSIFSNNLNSAINLPTLSSDIQVNGAFIKAQTKQITISNSTFTDAVAQLGIIYIWPSDKELQVNITECNFINLLSFSSGSAIYLQGSQSQLNINIQKSLFSNIYLDFSSNYKTDIKAAIHVLANQNADISNNIINLSELILENISGMQSVTNPTYFFSVGKSSITADQIKATRFIVNVKAYSRIFKSLKISNNKQVYSSIFQIYTSSILQMSNVTLDEPDINDLVHTLQLSTIIHPILINMMSGSSLTAINVNITQVNSNSQGGIIYAFDSLKVQFKNFISKSVEILNDNNIQVIERIPYQGLQNSLLNFRTVKEINIQNSHFECADIMDDKAMSLVQNECSGRILQAFESTINIKDSSFKGYFLNKGNGTAISLINMKGVNTFTNLNFERLRNLSSGGAIFIYSNFNTQIDNIFSLFISQSTFFNNTSKSLGGAIVFENDPLNVVFQFIQLDISNSRFEQNKANIAACIYYNNFIPTISESTNSFIQNKANMGNILFSQPRLAKLIQTSQIEETILKKDLNYSNLTRTDNTSLQIIHASGQKLPTLSFKLYFYDSPSESQNSQTEQEVQIKLLNYDDLSSKIKILLYQYPLSSIPQSSNLPFAIQGASNIFINETGNYIYVNINIWSEPDFDLNLEINFQNIKQIDQVNKRILPSFSYNSQIFIRSCSQFETISEPLNIPTINLSQNVTQCNKCPNLTFAYQQSICQECPIGADCKQDENIIVKPNYWRKNFDTYEILQCDDNFASCLGGPVVGDSLCVEGYIGALCQECDLFAEHWSESYAKQGQYFCIKCKQMILSYLVLAFITVLTIIFAYISISSNSYFIYKKIANNLVQRFRNRKRISSQKSKVEDQSPNSGQKQEDGEIEQEEKEFQQSSGAHFKIIASYLQIIGSVGSFNIRIPSFVPQISSAVGNPIRVSLQSMDCLLRNYQGSIPYHFYKYILSLTVPLWYYLVILFIIFLHCRFKKERFQKNYLFSAAVFLFIYLQPDLVQQAIDLISCVQIGEQLYIFGNLNHTCLEDEHIHYIGSLLIPSILILLLIIPLFLFLLLRRNKLILERIHFRIKWAFLYHEYTPQNYAWEFVKMYEKLIIVIVLSVFNSQNNVKASLMILVLILYAFLLLKHKPFKENVDNKVELYSSISCIMTMILVVLIIQNQINLTLQMIAIVLIILFNLLTIILIFIRVLSRLYLRLVITKSKLLTKFPKIAGKIAAFLRYFDKFLYSESKPQEVNQTLGLVNSQFQQSMDIKSGISISKKLNIPQDTVKNKINNLGLNNTMGSSIFSTIYKNQQWYQKYRGSVTNQSCAMNQSVLRSRQNSNQEINKSLQTMKKVKIGITLNKILNFNISPQINEQQQKQQNSIQTPEKSTNIFTKNYIFQDYLNDKTTSINQLPQFQERLPLDSSPNMIPMTTTIHNELTSSQNMNKYIISNISQNDNISHICDQKEFFIVSEDDLNLQISPKIYNSVGEQQEKKNKKNQIFFK